MKRTLFSICALVAVLVGCSKSDVVDAPNIDTPISFDVYSGKVPVSKATSIDDETDLSTEGGFKVYAYNTTTDDNSTYTPNWGSLYFSDSLFSNDGNTWTFTSGNTYYWPQDGSNLLFHAFSNNSIESGTTAEYTEGAAGASPSLLIKVANEVANQRDILVADVRNTKSTTTTTETGESDSRVALTFKHVLSRVYFTLNANREIKVTSVILNGSFIDSKVLNFENSSYSIEEATGAQEVTSYNLLGAGNSFEYSSSNKDTEKNIYPSSVTTPDATNSYMMIHSGTPQSIEILYEFLNDETNSKYKAEATFDNDFTFKVGYSYKFALVMESQEIKFKATVDSWKETNENNESTVDGVEFTITNVTTSGESTN